VTEIVKGVVAGGWSILLGWIIPPLVNSVLFTVVVLPGFRHEPVLGSMPSVPTTTEAVAVLLVAIVTGLVLLSLQRPLYRVLEGYLLWPGPTFAWGSARQLRTKRSLHARLEL